MFPFSCFFGCWTWSSRADRIESLPGFWNCSCLQKKCWSCDDWSPHAAQYIGLPYCVVAKWTQNDDSCIMFCALHHSCFAKYWTIDKRLRLRKIVYYWFENAECDYNIQNMIWTVVGRLWTLIQRICCWTVTGTCFDWWLLKNWTRWWWFSLWTSWQNYWATVLNCN